MPGGTLRRAAAAMAAGALGWSAATCAATAVERGEYLTAAGGCVTCHTAPAEGAPRFAGGRALKTAFGTFHTPNITPDPVTGIGRWSAEQFVRAVQEGVGPDGRHYYPAFPYTSYTGMSREDALAIRAYLFSLPPVRQPNRPHELAWYVDTRLAAAAWQLLFFRPGRFVPVAGRGDEWNRGAYLVRHLGHCGECHTPRDRLGVSQGDRELAGSDAGPEGKKVPGIRIDAHAVADWSLQDLETFLEVGMLPDGDFVGAGMGEVVTENTGRLTPGDRHAVAVYLQSVGR
jgi:mono/diheme cytochrome c family protein